MLFWGRSRWLCIWLNKVIVYLFVHFYRGVRLKDGTLTIAVIAIQQIFNRIVLVLNILSGRHRLKGIQCIVNHLTFVPQFISFFTVLIQSYTLQHKSSDFKGSEWDIFRENLIENIVLFFQVNHTVPVPLILHKLPVLHIGSQGHLHNAVIFDHISIKCSQNRANMVLRKQNDILVESIVEVLNSEGYRCIVPWLHKELYLIKTWNI